RHEQGRAVGGEGQLGGPAAQEDPAIPAVVVEQLGRQEVAGAVDPPGEPLAVGAEEHDLVGAAATHGESLVIPADGHAVGVGRGLAPGVERQGGERGLIAAEIDPGQPLPEDPAQVDVVPGGGEPPILQIGDVARLAVGADGNLAEVVAVDGYGP